MNCKVRKMEFFYLFMYLKYVWDEIWIFLWVAELSQVTLLIRVFSHSRENRVDIIAWERCGPRKIPSLNEGMDEQFLGMWLEPSPCYGHVRWSIRWIDILMSFIVRILRVFVNDRHQTAAAFCPPHLEWDHLWCFTIGLFFYFFTTLRKLVIIHPI